MNTRNLILVICCLLFALTSCQKEELTDLTSAVKKGAKQHAGGGGLNTIDNNAPIFPAPCVDSSIPFTMGMVSTYGVTNGIFIDQNTAYTGYYKFLFDQIAFTYTPDNNIAYTFGKFGEGTYTTAYLNISPYVNSPNTGVLTVEIPFTVPNDSTIYYITFTYCTGNNEISFCSDKQASQHTKPCPGSISGGPGVTFTVIMSVVTDNFTVECFDC